MVVTGVVQGWRQLGSVGAITSTSFGRLVLVKTVLVAAMIAAAAVSRRLVHGRLIPRRVGQPPIDADADAEPALGPSLDRRGPEGEGPPRGGDRGGGVVVTSALMVTHPTGSAAGQAAGGTLAIDKGDDAVLLSLFMEPARVGANTIHLALRSPSLGAEVYEEVALAASLPSRQLGPLPIAIEQNGRNHFTTSTAQFPFPGSWKLTITVLVSEFDRRTFAGRCSSDGDLVSGGSREQERSSLRDVQTELFRQGVGVGEAHLVPDQLDEPDRDRTPVERAVESDHMGLEEPLVPFLVERRPTTERDGCWPVDIASDIHPTGIDAVGRKHLLAIHGDVRRRESQRSSPFIAVFYDA